MGLVSKILMKDLAIGLKRTVTYNYQKAVTMQYPKEKWTPYPAFRGIIRLLHDDEGNLKCIACGMCARACPVGCITVKGEGKGKERKPVEFTINFGECLFCGLCVEACPVEGKAIEMSSYYEAATYDKQELIFDIQKLQADYKAWERTFKK